MNDKPLLTPIRKISLVLPIELHRQLKVIAAQRGTTMQDILMAAAQMIVDPPKVDDQTATQAFELPTLTPEFKTELESKFRNLLESGDAFAVFNCALLTEAARITVEQNRRGGGGALLAMPPKLVRQPGLAAQSNVEAAKPRRMKKAVR